MSISNTTNQTQDKPHISPMPLQPLERGVWIIILYLNSKPLDLSQPSSSHHSLFEATISWPIPQLYYQYRLLILLHRFYVVSIISHYISGQNIYHFEIFRQVGQCSIMFFMSKIVKHAKYKYYIQIMGNILESSQYLVNDIAIWRCRSISSRTKIFEIKANV